MSNNAIATKSNEMSLNGAKALVSEVTSGLALVQKGYLSVTPQIAKLYDCKGFKALGYKNFDEMCMLEWGMSHGTSVGIRKIFAMVGTVSANNEYKIPDKYMEYGYTKLLKIAENKTDFEKANIKPFEMFTPAMTIREMIDTLELALEDKAKEQDANAIDVNNEPSTDNEPSTENEPITDNEPSTDNEASTENEAKTFKDIVKSEIESLHILTEMAKNENIKEKDMSLLEASLDYLKQFEKKLK